LLAIGVMGVVAAILRVRVQGRAAAVRGWRELSGPDLR
jgi:hypothetical protein